MSEIQLPEGWVWSKIGAVTIINPKLNQKDIPDDLAVSFLPMKMVEEVTGKFDLSEIRQYKEVKKGYTFFQDGDVIFAKVTPCMENGKIAVVDHLENGLGFGSTEFHVFRCEEKLDNKYLFFFLVQRQFRHEAEGSMTGAVGLRRVPKSFLENYSIPLPPLPVQRQIVARIEELFSELDAGTQELKTALKRLKMYRQAVLHHYLSNEEWERVKLKDVCRKIQDGSHFSPQIQYGSPGVDRFPYITAKNIRVNRMDLSNVTYVSRDFHETIYSRCNPEYGDVLLTKDGVNAGDVTLNTLDEAFSLLSSVCLIKTNPDVLLPSFLKYFIQSPQGSKNILGKMTGTAIKRIILKQIKESAINLPETKMQQLIVLEIEQKLSEADATEATIRQSLKQADALRQSILKRAFEGRLIQPEGNIIPEFISPVKQQTNVINEQLSLF